MRRASTRERDLLGHPVAKPKPALEFRVHCMIADTLRAWAMPGWRWWHITSGEKRSAITGARLKRMGAQRGLPDFELLAPLGGNPRPHFLELKRKGNKPTAEQADFFGWCDDNDCPYAVVYSFDQALAQLSQWGAIKTTIKVSA